MIKIKTVSDHNLDEKGFIIFDKEKKKNESFYNKVILSVNRHRFLSLNIIIISVYIFIGLLFYNKLYKKYKYKLNILKLSKGNCGVFDYDKYY